jgi:hypothetical protein
MNLLGELVRTFPLCLISLQPLAEREILDKDFFANITHIQEHRRYRAMAKLRKVNSETPLKSVIPPYQIVIF